MPVRRAILSAWNQYVGRWKKQKVKGKREEDLKERKVAFWRLAVDSTRGDFCAVTFLGHVLAVHWPVRRGIVIRGTALFLAVGDTWW